MDILMNKKKGNNKIYKKTKKRRGKRLKGGATTKKYIVKFAVDDPVSNSVKILKDLTSGTIALDADKIKVVGVDGNPNFKSALQREIQSDASLTSLQARFGTSGDGFISDARRTQILAESAAAEAKAKAETATQEAITAATLVVEDSDLLGAMFDDD